MLEKMEQECGILSASSDAVELRTINGVQVAVAEVELNNY